MKKIIFPLVLLSLLTACGDSGDKKKTDASDKVSAPEITEKDITQDTDYKKGLKLTTSSDCYTCHKIDEPFTGPTYRDVANKYANMPDTIVAHLAGKIIKGGNGVWGTVYMTPHPAVTQEQAEAMVRYILLLKK